VSPVKYELGFYIPEDDILHSHRRENLKSYEGPYVRRHDTPGSVVRSIIGKWRKKASTSLDTSYESPATDICYGNAIPHQSNISVELCFLSIRLILPSA
jgi:hypothetical protein